MDGRLDRPDLSAEVLSTACRAAPPPRRSRAAPRRSAMPISRADVRHGARPAPPPPPDEAPDRFQAQLWVILEEAEKVKRLPTEGVPPTSHPLPRVNVWR